MFNKPSVPASPCEFSWRRRRDDTHCSCCVFDPLKQLRRRAEDTPMFSGLILTSFLTWYQTAEHNSPEFLHEVSVCSYRKWFHQIPWKQSECNGTPLVTMVTVAPPTLIFLLVELHQVVCTSNKDHMSSRANRSFLKIHLFVLLFLFNRLPAVSLSCSWAAARFFFRPPERILFSDFIAAAVVKHYKVIKVCDFHFHVDYLVLLV